MHGNGILIFKEFELIKQQNVQFKSFHLDVTKPEKREIVINELTSILNENKNIYLTDISGLDAKNSSDLRRACFKGNIKLAVIKNTLLAKAMEASDKDFGELPEVLKGNTSLMLSETGNAPAKLIKDFRKKKADLKLPSIKLGYLERSIFSRIFHSSFPGCPG